MSREERLTLLKWSLYPTPTVKYHKWAGATGWCQRNERTMGRKKWLLHSEINQPNDGNFSITLIKMKLF